MPGEFPWKLHRGQLKTSVIGSHCWLVVSFNPSEKYESVGMMKFPTPKYESVGIMLVLENIFPIDAKIEHVPVTTNQIGVIGTFPTPWKSH